VPPGVTDLPPIGHTSRSAPRRGHGDRGYSRQRSGLIGGGMFATASKLPACGGSRIAR